MLIRDWDIWYTYSSFLEVSHIDLTAAASALVRSGLSPCVVHRDGQTWWKVENQVRTGQTLIQLSQRGVSATVSLEVDGGGDAGLEGYTKEVWTQACNFRFNEMRLCKDGPLPPPYIRVTLGEFHLTSSDENISVILYPVVKLFETGVILVQFRLIAPDRDIPLEEFIPHYVDLGGALFNEVLVPPSVTELAAKAYFHSATSWPLYWRYLLHKAECKHDQAVEELTQEIESGDFSAMLAPMTSEGEAGDTLSSIASTLYSIIGYVISKPRSGAIFLLRGQVDIISSGNYWSGRPHIHVLDFEGQKISAKENISAFGGEFGLILGRTVADTPDDGLRYLTDDLRHFDDLSSFISQSATLWVWSLNGKERQAESADANRGHLIYEQQAIVELLEYGYMLHRALLSKVEKAKDANEIHELRWAVNHLQFDMENATHFGETRALLFSGWDEIGLAKLKDRISAALSIRSEQVTFHDARRSERQGKLLTIVFGMIAVPPIANDVLSPAWDLLGWWTPCGESAKSLFFIVIAVAFVILLVSTLNPFGWGRRKF